MNYGREKEIEEIKKIHPVDILSDLQIRYKKRNGYYSCYLPWKEDRDPSMSVFLNREGFWKWKDHTTGEAGTWIDLYMKIMKFNYVDAVRYLRNKFMIEEEKKEEIINTENKEENKEEWKIRDIEERPIRNQKIINFLREERKISHIPNWLKEVHYTKIHSITGEAKKYFGFGIKDSLGNYHIRFATNRIKEFILRKNLVGSTYTLIDKQSKSVIIVEGFIDGIRIDQLYPKVDIVILNGVGNVEKIFPIITAKYDNVGIATDQDPAGEDAATRLINELSNKKIYRFRFNAKDIDEAVKKKEKIQIIRIETPSYNIQP